MAEMMPGGGMAGVAQEAMPALDIPPNPFAPASPEEPAVDPVAILPGDPDARLDLFPEQLETLGADVEQILVASDSAMDKRRKRLREIDKAYDLIPDNVRGGIKPDASRLVSERTRADCYVASSRLTQGIMGVSPMMVVKVVGGNSSDPGTENLTKLAEDTEQFFENYPGLDRERWLPLVIQRATRQGDAIVRAMWKVESTPYTFRNQLRQIETTVKKTGRLDVDLIDNEYVHVWPLNETDPRRVLLFGHDTYLSTAEFRTFCVEHDIEPAVRDEIIATAQKNRPSDDAQRERLENKDIETSRNPFDGEVKLTELWYTGTLPGEEDGEATGPTGSFLIFFYRPLKKVLWIGPNPLGHGRRHPYFRIPYWREDGSFWSTGVGQELVFVQAADSAFWNLWVDNLKVIGANLQVLKSGTGAHDQMNEIGPGKRVVTDDPEGDIRTVALGGELNQIQQASQQNEFRGTKLTSITPPLQGMGDPVLKSGASPSSIAQLIEQAATKFGQVDKNIREALGDLYMFFLELVQQYADEGVFYAHASEDSARRLLSLKYMAPTGDLRQQLLIRAKAPSATSNREMLKSHLGIVYQLAQNHMMVVLQIGSQVIAAENQEGFMRMAREAFVHLHKLYLRFLEAHDIPGASVGAPQIPETTPEDVKINELNQMVAMAQQQIMQLQAALSEATGGQVPMPEGMANAA